MKLKQWISDGAIFQRNESIAISGVTDSPGPVRIEIAGKTYYGAAGFDGSFLIRIPAMQAGGPYELTVTNTITQDSICVKDILIGEVWLGAGQSNMELPFRETPRQRKEFQQSDSGRDDLRIFTVRRRASSAQENDVVGQWEKSDSPAVNDFSALSLWFARELHAELGVPVGIIVAAWGGTKIATWISRQTLMQDENWKKRLQEYDSAVVLPARWEDEKILPYNDRMNHIFSEYCEPCPPESGFEKGWHTVGYDDSAWQDFRIPQSWIQKGLSGNGTVWIRKHFQLPERWLHKDLELQLGGIDKQDITYFNGVEIGRTGCGFDQLKWNVPRIYPIPGKLVQKTENLLAVRAYSFVGDGSFNGNAEDYSLYCPELKETICIAGDVLFCKEHDFGKVQAPPPERFALPEGPEQIYTPSLLFDSMIRPLIPCTVKGVLWYQGEENSIVPEDANSYRKMLSMLISDWRFHWGLGSLPFIITQIANFGEPRRYDKDSLWAVVRNAQMQVARQEENVSLVVTADVGEAGDIHPKDKRSVAQRNVRRALRNVYRQDIQDHCVYPLSFVTKEDQLIVSFSVGGDEFILKETPEVLFFLCGEDGEYYPADEVELSGGTLRLCSYRVGNPVHVRYAWANNPAYLALFTVEGEPVTPFEL